MLTACHCASLLFADSRSLFTFAFFLAFLLFLLLLQSFAVWESTLLLLSGTDSNYTLLGPRFRRINIPNCRHSNKFPCSLWWGVVGNTKGGCPLFKRPSPSRTLNERQSSLVNMQLKLLATRFLFCGNCSERHQIRATSCRHSCILAIKILK